MTDIHASIRAFLQPLSIVMLHDGAPDDFSKAGVAPFVRPVAEAFKYFLMKPIPKIPALGAPPFQICKGTRQYLGAGGWRDVHDGAAGEKESAAETALREGVEELGLKPENIQCLFDLGSFEFASATTGKPKSMRLFAAEMKSKGDFLAVRQIAPTTDQRAWLSLAEFAVVGRADHRYILETIEKTLKEHLRDAGR
jgi:8-oxo-dGTP pyrophosphatase MutT (NUDIX family)